MYWYNGMDEIHGHQASHLEQELQRETSVEFHCLLLFESFVFHLKIRPYALTLFSAGKKESRHKDSFFRREISEALERFTNLMEKIYLQQPYKREIVRLTMALVGRGGQGDVGQRIRDEILVIQVNGSSY